jgi:hypothetical protein
MPLASLAILVVVALGHGNLERRKPNAEDQNGSAERIELASMVAGGRSERHVQCAAWKLAVLAELNRSARLRSREEPCLAEADGAENNTGAETLCHDDADRPRSLR